MAGFPLSARLPARVHIDPATAAFTPSPTPARCAARAGSCGCRTARRSATAMPSLPRWPLLRAGQIVAIKGLGGFHLACDARNAGRGAPARAQAARAKTLCGDAGQRRLGARPGCRPARSRGGAAAVARAAHRAVAQPAPETWPNALPADRPGPAHAGRDAAVHARSSTCCSTKPRAGPQGTGLAAGRPQDLLLVMTSANPGGEPLVTGQPEALTRLQGLADAWLLHNRDIVARCDDSVLRPAAGGSAAVHPPRARLHAQAHQAGAAAAPACWPPAPG
jgi:hydrogenase maturation protein HypF